MTREADAELQTWGRMLFARAKPGPRHPSGGVRIPTSDVVRREVRLAVKRAPQVMVKVTGGGRGMAVIRAHMNYIDREGDGLNDQDGERHEGREARREIARQWAREGTPIPERSDRREAFNIMWSMPAGTDSRKLLAAVRALAARQFAGHKYVMALHTHQANPHVHVLVRAESDLGVRLNPRKPDLHEWRMEFAAELRERGIAAAASRQAARGVVKDHLDIWQVKAQGEGRLRNQRVSYKDSQVARDTRADALRAWNGVAAALAQSDKAEDRNLARQVLEFVNSMPIARERAILAQRLQKTVERGLER
jgi:relaxase-like protein